MMTLDELDALCRREVKVFIPGPLKDGKPAAIAVTIRRLTPQETARVRELREAVVPPVVTVEDEETGRSKREYDFANADYTRKLAGVAVTSRALAVWLGCEWFRAGAPPGTGDSTEKIQEYVQGRLTDSLIELIYQQIIAVDGRLEEQVDFFSEPASRTDSDPG